MAIPVSVLLRHQRRAKPGDYRLLIYGQAGTAEQPNPSGQTVQITIHEGIRLARFNLFLGIFALIWCVTEWLRHRVFERRRWAPVTEDD